MSIFSRYFLPTAILSLAFPLAFASAEEREPVSHAARLVQQLGAPDYYVREWAQAELLKMGIEAFNEVKEALNNSDPEIAERAKDLFSRYENDATRLEHPEIQETRQAFAETTDPTEKAWIIRHLGNDEEFPKAEGLTMLCRLARFYQEEGIRAEAAKTLIVSSPMSPRLRKKWYHAIRMAFGDPRRDELFRTVALYAEVGAAVQRFQETDKPASEAPDELRERVRLFAAQLARFQENPAFHVFIRGGCTDILTFYTLAEFQQAVGLNEDCKRTIAAARAIVPEKPACDDLYSVYDPYRFSNWAGHYTAGRVLLSRAQLEWAAGEFELVVEKAQGTPLVAYAEAASSALWMLREDYDKALALWEKSFPVLRKLESQGTPTGFLTAYLDSNGDYRVYEARATYLKAKAAAERDDWAEVKKLLGQALEKDDRDIDLLVLRYELNAHLPDLDPKYKEETERRINGELTRFRQTVYRTEFSETALHSWAWLAACTNRSPLAALECVREVLKDRPDDINVLDTQARAYAANKEYDKAVEIMRSLVRRAPEVVSFRKALERFEKEVKK